MEKLNELSKQLHESAKKKGFWDGKKEIGTLLMLIVSELSEALEADRTNKHANIKGFESYLWKDNDLQSHSYVENFKNSFEECIKDTFEDEISDTFIRLFDLVGYLNIDIEKHIELKLKYNKAKRT